MNSLISRNRTLTNIYDRNIEATTKKILTLHEDLQYDFNVALEDF